MEIKLTVNKQTISADVKPNRLLVHFLREDLALLGAHVGCVEGVCGACTVLVDGKPTKSCLMFAVQADGKEITTVESLAQNGELNDLQKAFTEEFALQCGYCTPGMLMTATALISEDKAHSDEEIRTYMRGNLCRCTGYLPIVDAIKKTQRGKE